MVTQQKWGNGRWSMQKKVQDFYTKVTLYQSNLVHLGVVSFHTGGSFCGFNPKLLREIIKSKTFTFALIFQNSRFCGPSSSHFQKSIIHVVCNGWWMVILRCNLLQMDGCLFCSRAAYELMQAGRKSHIGLSRLQQIVAGEWMREKMNTGMRKSVVEKCH